MFLFSIFLKDVPLMHLSMSDTQAANALELGLSNLRDNGALTGATTCYFSKMNKVK